MKRRTLLAVGSIGLLVLGLVAWLLWPGPSTSGSDAAYVTAPASRGTVTQTLTVVGPVEREGMAKVTSDSPGLVTAVLVKVGDQVAAGQQLVSLDTADLRLSVLQARAQLAQAQAQLDADLAARDSGAGRTPVSLPSSMTGAGAPGAGNAAPTGGGLADMGAGASAAQPPAYLTAMQASLQKLQGVVARQQKVCTPVFVALQQAREQVGSAGTPGALPTQLPSALPTQVPSAPPTSLPSQLPSGLPTALPSQVPSALPSQLPTSLPSQLPSAVPSRNVPTGASSGDPSASPSAPTAGPTTSDTPSATSPAPSAAPTSPSTAPTSSTRPGAAPAPTVPAEVLGLAEQVQACSAAMAEVAQAEGEAGASIGAAVQGFAASTQQAQAAMAQAQTQMQEAARQASEQAIKEAQKQLAEQMAGSMGRPVTDATIASDRATVLQAQQRLDGAEADLASANLVAPVSGVVGALDLVVGESSAGRSLTIVGDGAARISIEVPLAQRALVRPGVPAAVGQLAGTPSFNGRVTSVGVLPTSTSGTPTYSAEVVADDAGGQLLVGSYAQVRLALAEASDVLVVPASAVTATSDTTGTVEVVDQARATSASSVDVVLGRRGGGRVEIVSGLTEGQLVVLADRRLPVPGGMGQYRSMTSASATPTPSR